MHRLTKLFCYCFLFLLLFIVPQVHAEDFKSDYKVNYFLGQGTDNHTKVQFEITITSYTAESYISKFTLSFPKLFSLDNLYATYNKQPIVPDTSTVDNFNVVKLDLPNPQIGKNITNTIYVEFDQKKLANITGNIWEVMLPTLSTNGSGNYQVIVHLPDNFNKKISIAKPKPSSNTGNTITWDNPTTKIVYAVFGDSQYYNTKLTYHLENDNLGRAYADVAFPPDTLYQKIVITNLNFKPAKTYQDEDGNLMARYYLNGKEKKDIVLDETIQVLPQPRDEMIPLIQASLQKQKTYLLSSNNLWKAPQSKEQTVADIYHFVTNTLKYDYKKIDAEETTRMGAAQALAHPDEAVCTEFTDTFVALSRAHGIYSREMEGYGFSNDPQLRPLSLKSDVLHAWPEYFDTQSQIWQQVDPTWENTSGIDYFSSFDVNHIVFAIHGKKPDYPYPAGTYKFTSTKDVDVQAVSTAPQVQSGFSLSNTPFSSNMLSNKPYNTTIDVTNTGNTYVQGAQVQVTSPDLQFTPSTYTIANIAPMETVNIPVSYESKDKNARLTTTVDVFVNGKKVSSARVSIVPYYFKLAMYLFIVTIIVGLLTLLLRFSMRKKR